MCSEGERYDNVERVDTRDVSVKRGKNREEGEGDCEGCPRKNRKFHRVEIRGEQRGEVDGEVKEKGLGRLEAACLQELRVARSRGIHRG